MGRAAVAVQSRHLPTEAPAGPAVVDHPTIPITRVLLGGGGWRGAFGSIGAVMYLRETGRVLDEVERILPKQPRVIMLALDSTISGDLGDMAAMERRAGLQPGEGPGQIPGRFGALARRVVEALGDSVAGLYLTGGDIMVNTCAALVGAPLTHDFCAISLSDLLTPWPTIARRLDAVAYSDFVVALYNPKSGRRTRQIVEARRLFLRHRRPDTPVAIVKSAYRPRQRIEFTTLEKMIECDIGMLSTVLIGNSNTFIRHGLMVTPRGYRNKYDVESGTTHEGEQAGRSLSTGLTGWLAGLRASGRSAAELATEHRLPEDYIAALLAEPAELDDEADDETAASEA